MSTYLLSPTYSVLEVKRSELLTRAGQQQQALASTAYLL